MQNMRITHISHDSTMPNLWYYSPNPVLSTFHLTESTQAPSQQQTVTTVSLTLRSPVEVMGNEVDIDQSQVQVGQWVPYTIKDKKYVLHKPKEGTIEIYEVK